MSSVQKIEFQTVDGITLRGHLFQAGKQGPAVIMTPGFNMVKEICLPDIAAEFQRNGITALIYDPRNYGESHGSPRNQLDPLKHAEDYSDAFTFLAKQPCVDSTQIYFWGWSYSGSICLGAASLDVRIRGAIVLCPWVNDVVSPDTAHKAMKKFLRDRESQLQGNPPFYIPIVDSTGANPVGWGPALGQEMYRSVARYKETIAPNFEPKITLQSYFKMLQWNPYSMLRFLDSTPVLMVVPELDHVCPPQIQRDVFDSVMAPKRIFNAEGCGHEDVAVGDKSGPSLECQVQFIRDVQFGCFP
ncbi:Acetyl xylan esterase [Penicillium brasilianum]|uniref:Acetyl xylan esterase n=1 Tax=Penicillium brasilianum TaxID=104259 RepID=A0A1S9R7X1_PENBI|nr:Acetyl xylan esterase [Penicillium brasilianum]